MASFVDNPNKLDWAMSFQRTGTFPLDRSSMFSSKADAENYAKGDGSDSRALGGAAYIGQVISVFENDVVTVYKINADRTLGNIGVVVGTDEKSIHLTDEGIIALMGLDAATDGQQLRVKVVDGERSIEWFSPDTSTVEGLQTAVGALQKTVNGEFNEGGELVTPGLTQTVATHTSQISEIQSKLTSVLHYKGSCAYDALPADAEVGDVWNISSLPDGGATDIRGNDIHVGDNVIYIVDGETKGWDVSTGLIDLSGYYTKGQTDTAISDAVSTAKTELEGKIQEVANNATKVEKSDTNGNVKVDGTEVEVYKLPTATEEALGGIKSSASNTADKVVVAIDGTAGIDKYTASKIEGVVAEASKVTNALKIGTKSYDGSSEINITATDIPLPDTVVHNTNYGTAAVGGVVKSSDQKDYIQIASDGLMLINTISANKIDGVVAEASKVTNALTIGAKTFDGSAAVNITAEDLPIPTDVVRFTDIATAAKAGVVKSSTSKDQIAVGNDGVMSINTISGAKVDGAVAEATNATKLGGVAAANILVADAESNLTSKVKAASAADQLSTAREISLTGDATGAANFDGSAATAINVTLADSGVTAGEYAKVKVDSKGRVTEGLTLAATDIPTLTLAKISDAGTLAAKSEVARTDLAAGLEADIAALESASHTHDNKTVLDGITSAKIEAWDKVVNKADKATTLAGYGITDAYTKTEIDGKLGGAFHYKGAYDSFAALIAAVTEPMVGDVYNIKTAGGTDSEGIAIKAGDNVVCKTAKTESVAATWDVLSGTVDLSAYYNKTEVDTKVSDAKTELQSSIDGVSGRVDTLETTVGDAESGLVKDVATLKSDMTTAKSDISTLKTTVGDAKSGLVKDVADNTAAITTLNGAENVEGSVKKAVKDASDALDNKITEITKDGGTIDTKIEAHNTAADAHADLFAAKQNKVFQQSLTVATTAFAAAADTEPGEYVGSFSISGVDAAKAYKVDVVPVIDSVATHKAILAAGFLPMTSYETGVLKLYAMNAPTAEFTVSLTFTEIQ